MKKTLCERCKNEKCRLHGTYNPHFKSEKECKSFKSSEEPDIIKQIKEAFKKNPIKIF